MRNCMDHDETPDTSSNLSEIVPEMAGTFKALGDLTRLRIIHLLSTDTSGTLGVGELAARLNISQPAVSQHLKTLRSEGLVDSRREGFYTYYTIDLSLIHISEPTRRTPISYAVFCLKKK